MICFLVMKNIVTGVEMVGKKKRELTGIVLNYFYAVGEAIVSPIAWYTRDWKPTQLSVSLPPIIFIVYYWYVFTINKCMFMKYDKYRLDCSALKAFSPCVFEI